MNQVKAIINGALIDGTGAAPLKDAVILVKEGKITHVGAAGEFNVPDDAELIDATGKTIIPGMTDCHVHMKWVPTGEKPNEGDLALQCAHALHQSLMKGITTVRSQGEYFNTAFAVKRAQMRGQFTGSRLMVCGSLIAATGGHGNIVADGPWECRMRVRQAVNHGADHIKIGTTHRPWRGLEEFKTEELDALVDEAHKYGKKVACHAAMMPGMAQAIEAGVDSVEHGPSEFPGEASDEEVRMLAESGAWWVPTLWVFLHERSDEEKAEWENNFRLMDPWDAELTRKWMLEDLLEYAPINFRKCLEAGVTRIATGTDTMGGNRFHSFGEAHEEAILFVKYGMKPMDAIKAATLNGAKLYGEDDFYGSVELGKHADIVVLGADPLKDITALRDVQLVMQGGKVYKNTL